VERRFAGLAAWLFVAVLALTSCVSDRPQVAPRPPAPARGPVTQLHLLASPVALNLDQTPGPDGFGVRVYASSSRTSAAVVIARGTLEVLMFDGLLKDTNAATATPRRVWSFPQTELKKHEQPGSFGVAYVLTLPWGDTPPTQSRVTLVARYLPPKGAPIYSGASAIPVALK
jgi:hypothetical protein